MCKYLFEILFLILLDMYPEVGLLDHMVILFVIFWGISILFLFYFYLFIWPCHAACRILVPRPGIKPGPPAVEAQSLNHWTAREVPIVGILTGVRWYLIMVLICISLTISYIEHIFICLFAICLSSLEKLLFKSFVQFLIGLLVFWCWVVEFLYIFWI